MTTQENSGRLTDFLEFMNRKGLNTTSQRRTIAEAFFELPGHHSLEEFYQHILQRDPGIGQTTVYRTLKLLCDAGLAMEIHFTDGITRYEIAKPDSHHDHLVCLECGKIVEICDGRIEKIQRELAENHGFRLRGHVHNLYGICAECRQKAAANS
ncbi:Fur family transcriptional regulator [uncultured Desulfovibrio sp.]|uniref:Fur family transcriptional regulator n=1 Tax=uncultured Desulfovibrio sp. TaxID=167968 RepID=UPI001B0E1CAE|nr:transcriptional repressor [uncultured Desulfovibrio sp.]MBO5490695.1 transcriptional repressor [Desulfovibrio sp.]